MINAIYNKNVLRLAADITCIGTLENSDATASLRSPLCGSSIRISIKLRNGRVTAYGQEIKACALGQASASVMAQAIIGKSKNDTSIKLLCSLVIVSCIIKLPCLMHFFYCLIAIDFFYMFFC